MFDRLALMVQCLENIDVPLTLTGVNIDFDPES